MNESNRQIASIDRIDELNQRIACKNDPKRPLMASWAVKTVPREPQSPQERPKTPPGALLERSWGHLGTIRSPDRQPDRSGSISVIVLGRSWRRFWSMGPSQELPKSSPRAPKTLQDPLQEPPRHPLTSPRLPKSSPRPSSPSSLLLSSLFPLFFLSSLFSLMSSPFSLLSYLFSLVSSASHACIPSSHGPLAL